MSEIIRRRNLYMTATLMCGLLAITFTFSALGIHWLWSDSPQVAIILAGLAVVFGGFLFRAQKQVRMQQK
jgi:hypothetical protein